MIGQVADGRGLAVEVEYIDLVDEKGHGKGEAQDVPAEVLGDPDDDRKKDNCPCRFALIENGGVIEEYGQDQEDDQFRGIAVESQ